MYFDDMGHPTVMDEGFRNMAELFVGWHLDGTMHPEMWPLSEGYAGANEEFANAELVFYMSGSWQVGQFSEQIGDAFDWQTVPNPCGPGGCTGMPGGAALVGIGATEHPKKSPASWNIWRARMSWANSPRARSSSRRMLVCQQPASTLIPTCNWRKIRWASLSARSARSSNRL